MRELLTVVKVSTQDDISDQSSSLSNAQLAH